MGAFGADIVLGCRDIVRGRQVVEEIYKNIQRPSNIDVMQIDTSSFESIRHFSQQYRDAHSKLDVLINNAGVNRAEQPREDSVDGIANFTDDIAIIFPIAQFNRGMESN